MPDISTKKLIKRLRNYYLSDKPYTLSASLINDIVHRLKKYDRLMKNKINTVVNGKSAKDFKQVLREEEKT